MGRSWAEDCLEPALRDAWRTDLAKAAEGYVYTPIQAQRSHPTELVARHAAEVLRKAGAAEAAVRAWFELSLAVSDSAPEGTMRRLGTFTRALAEGSVLTTSAPYGSLLNPSFEYR